jgi:hypothetical protein
VCFFVRQRYESGNVSSFIPKRQFGLAITLANRLGQKRDFSLRGCRVEIDQPTPQCRLLKPQRAAKSGQWRLDQAGMVLPLPDWLSASGHDPEPRLIPELAGCQASPQLQQSSQQPSMSGV